MGKLPSLIVSIWRGLGHRVVPVRGAAGSGTLMASEQPIMMIGEQFNPPIVSMMCLRDSFRP